MIKSGTSILEKLKNLSKSSGRSFQVCLQLFCQEEFLRRLEESKYNDNFILKGGFLIYSITGFDGRLTYDIDFLLQKTSSDTFNIQNIIVDIIGYKSNFVKFNVMSVEKISIHKEYPGVRIKLEAKIENTVTPFSIDIGVGDIIVPKSERVMVPTQLEEFRKPKIKAYSIESTLSEKLDAILNLLEFTSRMKDYYDIYFLIKNNDFMCDILTVAMKQTFHNRNRNFTLRELEEILSYGNNTTMIKKWENFLNKIEKEHVEFSDVISLLETFINIPYNCYIDGLSKNLYWDSQEQKWKKC